MTSILAFVQGIGTGPFGSMGAGSSFSTATIGGGFSAGFGNLSFEEPAGSYPTLTTGNMGPFGLSAGFNLVLVSSGVEYNVVFYPGTRGSVSAGVAGPYNLTGGLDTLTVSYDGFAPVSAQLAQGTTFTLTLDSDTPTTYALFDGATLVIKINNAPNKTVVFREDDFVLITSATRNEVAAVLGLSLSGVNVTPSGVSAIAIATDLLGDTAEVQIVGGSGASAFVVSSTVPGVGNTQDLSAVTAAEVVHALNAATPMSASRVGSGGEVIVESFSFGPSSSVAVTGTAAPVFALGLPTAGVTLIANMANVSAAEVSAALLAAGTGLTAVSVPGGKFALTTYPGLAGEVASIEVLGGAANATFGFPTNVVATGITNPGYARLWLVGVLSQGWSFVEFATTGPSLFPSAYEEFAKGWPSGSDPDALTVVTDISGSDVSGVFFGVGSGGPFLWEAMDWYPYFTDITATIAVTFSLVGHYSYPSSTEGFSNGYPDPSGNFPCNEFDAVTWEGRLSLEWITGPFLAFGVEFNSETLSNETFNTEWGYKTSVPLMGNERDIYDISGLGPERILDPVDFGQVGLVETFSDATPEHTDVTINDVTTGNIYAITIDGIKFSYVAQALDTVSAVATALASNIVNGNTTQASATYSFGEHVVITQVVPGKAMSVDIDGTNPSELSIVENQFVMPDSKWPGRFWNPSLV
jgi:hypothetical protein